MDINYDQAKLLPIENDMQAGAALDGWENIPENEWYNRAYDSGNDLKPSSLDDNEKEYVFGETYTQPLAFLLTRTFHSLKQQETLSSDLKDLITHGCFADQSYKLHPGFSEYAGGTIMECFIEPLYREMEDIDEIPNLGISSKVIDHIKTLPCELFTITDNSAYHSLTPLLLAKGFKEIQTKEFSLFTYLSSNTMTSTFNSLTCFNK